MSKPSRRRWLQTLAASAAVVPLIPGEAAARRAPTAYKCKIVNNTGKDVLVRIYHYNKNYVFSAKIAKTKDVITDPATGDGITEGDRAIVAWDDFNENVVAHGHKLINAKTIITLEASGDVTYAAY